MPTASKLVGVCLCNPAFLSYTIFLVSKCTEHHKNSQKKEACITMNYCYVGKHDWLREKKRADKSREIKEFMSGENGDFISLFLACVIIFRQIWTKIISMELLLLQINIEINPW